MEDRSQVRSMSDKAAKTLGIHETQQREEKFKQLLSDAASPSGISMQQHASL